jgi:hypothetical protein
MTTGTDKRTKSTHMRDIETIDGELRLLSRAWRVARELCDRRPSTGHIDERAAMSGPPPELGAGTEFGGPWPPELQCFMP